MNASRIPTPPTDEGTIRLHIPRSPASPRRTSGSGKSVKPISRISKRATQSASHDRAAHHGQHSPLDSRHKRVWKACERCRMKKTKCDGEFPCKRCKDDGLVCTAGTRKKTEYKQLPRGYAEVLENTQFALIATVHKLYDMVRSGQSWDLGEPELNDRRKPIIHNIASKLGCIRVQNDLDLPVGHIFPEDEAGLSTLAATLEAHQAQRERETGTETCKETSNGSPLSAVSSPQIKSESEPHWTERASSSELDPSDLETDYRKSVFGHMNDPPQARSPAKGTPSVTKPSIMPPTLSPQSLNYDFDVNSTTSDMDPTTVATPTLFPGTSPILDTFSTAPTWNPRSVSIDFAPDQMMRQMQTGNPTVTTATTANSLMDVDDLLNQGLLESDFGTLKPHLLHCPNPDVMMGMGDPMIFGGGYEAETLRM